MNEVQLIQTLERLTAEADAAWDALATFRAEHYTSVGTPRDMANGATEALSHLYVTQPTPRPVDAVAWDEETGEPVFPDAAPEPEADTRSYRQRTVAFCKAVLA